MNEQNFYRVSVKGVAFDEDRRVLLAREDNDRWEMLGGGLDHGEEPRKCLVREIQEESGLTVTNVSDNPIFFLTTPSSSGEFQMANIIYEIELANLDFIPSGECQELRFVNPAEALDLDLFSNVEKFIGHLAAQGNH